MKASIHPAYQEAQVTCSCGNTFVTMSTKPTITVEVCYKCHPFYTGEHRFIDTQGRVEKFQQKQKSAQEYKQTFTGKKHKEKKKDENQPKTLRELLSEV